jgi:hypothetical protein
MRYLQAMGFLCLVLPLIVLERFTQFHPRHSSRLLEREIQEPISLPSPKGDVDLSLLDIGPVKPGDMRFQVNHHQEGGKRFQSRPSR